MLLCELWKEKASTSWPLSTLKSICHLNQWKLHDSFCLAGCTGGEWWSRVGMIRFALCFGRRQVIDMKMWVLGRIAGLIWKRSLWVFVRRARQASHLFLMLCKCSAGRGPGCSQPFWFCRALKLSQNLQKPWRSLSSLEEFWVVYDFILKHWNPLEIYVVNFRDQMLSWQKLSLLNGWNFICFNWSVIALHCCVFCTTVWLSYLYACIVLPCEPPSHTTSPQNFK